VILERLVWVGGVGLGRLGCLAMDVRSQVSRSQVTGHKSEP
jgi:hypothetical protein